MPSSIPKHTNVRNNCNYINCLIDCKKNSKLLILQCLFANIPSYHSIIEEGKSDNGQMDKQTYRQTNRISYLRLNPFCGRSQVKMAVLCHYLAMNGKLWVRRSSLHIFSANDDLVKVLMRIGCL